MNWLPPKISGVLELVLCAGIIGWILYRWLKKTDDRGRLISKWAITAVMVGITWRIAVNPIAKLRQPLLWRQAAYPFSPEQIHLINQANDQLAVNDFRAAADTLNQALASLPEHNSEGFIQLSVTYRENFRQGSRTGHRSCRKGLFRFCRGTRQQRA